MTSGREYGGLGRADRRRAAMEGRWTFDRSFSELEGAACADPHHPNIDIESERTEDRGFDCNRARNLKFTRVVDERRVPLTA